jgi:uncharacterized protein
LLRPTLPRYSPHYFVIVMLVFVGTVAASTAAVVGVPAALSGLSRLRPRKQGPKPAPTSSISSENSVLRDCVRSTRSRLRSRQSGSQRLVEIDRIVVESPDTKSFYFRSLNGESLPSYRPGQHVIVERPASHISQRCYTLSNSSQSTTWRITVRRHAAINDPDSFSAWAHREWQVGDWLRVRGPRGSFVLDKADPSKPLVLLSAGIGITPIIAMLDEELSYPRSRAKWCFHQIRDLANAPLVAEMIQRVESSRNCLATIAISQLDHTPRCSSKRVALLPGKLDVKKIVQQVGTGDFHVLMCGPEPWMRSVRDALVANQVPDSQIHDESFGGSDSPAVTQDAPAADNNPSEPSAPAFSVSYESSGKIATYQSSKSNLLAHAKNSGILLPASCRAGHCGTCAVKLLRGKVQYLRPPEAKIANDEILPCICTPASDLIVQA